MGHGSLASISDDSNVSPTIALQRSNFHDKVIMQTELLKQSLRKKTTLTKGMGSLVDNPFNKIVSKRPSKHSRKKLHPSPSPASSMGQHSNNQLNASGGHNQYGFDDFYFPSNTTKFSLPTHDK